MSSKVSSSLRSCSASFAASKASKNSFNSSLSNSSSQRSRASESLSPTGRVSKNIFKRSCSTTGTRAQSFSRGNATDAIANPCTSLDGTPADRAVPKHQLQNLEDQLTNLQQELSKERNQNSLLRRNVMIAKKIVKREVGGNFHSFDCLQQKANDEDWMGRQEMIYFLRRKLRDLNETVERLEENAPYIRKRSKYSREHSPVSDIPDERQLFWCLELERQDVFKKADRDKQRWADNKDVLASKFQEAANKNEELLHELVKLRETISSTPKIIDEGVSERLRKLGNELRTHIDGKAEDRQKLDDLKLQICHNTKLAVELRAKISFEKRIVKDKEVLLKSLSSEEANLLLLAEEIRKENSDRANAMKMKLGEMEQEYTFIVKRTDKIITIMFESKEAVKKMERSYAKSSSNASVNNFKISKPLLSIDEGKESALHVKSLTNIDNESRKSMEALQNDVGSYDSKLKKYKSNLVLLERKNHEKSKQIDAAIEKTSVMVTSFLIDRYVLWKRTFETDVLRSRIKKIRKATNPSCKLKMVKKKDSFPQLVETLDVKKQYLTILKAESKSMKTLTKSIFHSAHDDFGLVRIFPLLHKDFFLKDFCKRFEK